MIRKYKKEEEKALRENIDDIKKEHLEKESNKKK